MNLLDLDRLLHATLEGTDRQMSVTVTDVPQHEHGVRELIAKACEVASLKNTRLLTVELPSDLMTRLTREYGDLDLRDCGQTRVLRFVYGGASAP